MKGENRSLQSELQSLQDSLEDEADRRSQLQKLCTKANNDMQLWKRKYENCEGVVRSDEVTRAAVAWDDDTYVHMWSTFVAT